MKKWNKVVEIFGTIINTLIILVLAAILIFFGLLTIVCIREIANSPIDTYTVEATVIEKDLIKTSDGNLWCADTNNKMIGGTATVTFENNGTPENIYDDIIIRIN